MEVKQGVWWMLPLAIVLAWVFVPKGKRVAVYVFAFAATILATALAHAYASLSAKNGTVDANLAAQSVEWGLAAVGCALIIIVIAVYDFLQLVRKVM